MVRRVPLLVLGLAAIVVGLAAGGLASLWAWKGDGAYVDATPADLSSDPRLRSGSVVWLRGRRDRERRLVLGDGRVLYPTVEDPRVMVDCGTTRCAGTLVGPVEELSMQGELPQGWPDGAGRRVRVVRVGAPGDAALGKATLAGAVAAVALLLGIASAVAGAFLSLRRRPG